VGGQLGDLDPRTPLTRRGADVTQRQRRDARIVVEHDASQ